MRLSGTGRLAALVPVLCAGYAFAQESAPIQSVQITGSSGAYDPRRDDINRSTFNRGYVRLRLSLEHKF